MKENTILIATPLYPPQVGGPASRTTLLEKKLPDMGFKVKVVKFSDVLGLPKVIRHIVYFFAVFTKAFTADTILAQDPVSTGLPAFLASRLLFKKFILIIVGDYAWEQGSQRAGVTDFLDQFSMEHDKYPFFVRLLKKVQFFVANHANKVIVPSFYLKTIVSNWGVNPDKVHVVYNSFNPPVISEEKEELRKKHGIQGLALISAGRLVPWKGFSHLITDIMPALKKEIPNASLYILGDGPDRAYLEKIIHEQGLQKHVHLTGRKNQEDLFEYIKAGDLFVLNTAYEGMSHQLLEVMALGTPIITTTIGGNKEIITHEENGLLFDYNNKEQILAAVLRIVNDKEFALALVEKSKEKIGGFSEEEMLENLSRELR